MHDEFFEKAVDFVFIVGIVTVLVGIGWMVWR